MRSKAVSMALGVFVLVLGAGCSESKTVRSDGDEGGEQKLVNLITQESCRQGPVVSRAEGRWISKQASEDITFDTVFDIGASRLNLTNYCSIKGRSLTARVSSPISHLQRKIRVWESQNDSATYDDGDFKADCNVGIEAAEIEYEFFGNCLVFKNGNEKFYLKQY